MFSASSAHYLVLLHSSRIFKSCTSFVVITIVHGCILRLIVFPFLLSDFLSYLLVEEGLRHL